MKQWLCGYGRGRRTDYRCAVRRLRSLKLSTWPFCIGSPIAMWCYLTCDFSTRQGWHTSKFGATVGVDVHAVLAVPFNRHKQHNLKINGFRQTPVRFRNRAPLTVGWHLNNRCQHWLAQPSWMSGSRLEVNTGKRVRLLSDVAEKMKTLEGQNRELRQANEILRKASAYFALVELELQGSW